MALLENLSDSEIRSKLAEFGHPVGPVTESTRRILLKRLGQLIEERKGTRPLKKNLSKLSSAEESGSENEYAGRAKRVSMPPPASFRSRRKPSSSSSMNASIADFRGARSPISSPEVRPTTSRSSSRTSPRGPRLSSYDFDSGEYSALYFPT